ncbi:MAG: sulfite exporter TauE/SafE family protein [Firmicutes bacterium]|nr:sulfite exporter TauE/SafE family protein [Bacillota bacterium]
MEALIFLLVSFGASVVGAICGIGGGVIIKPVLDMAGAAGVATISFLSGCTVLSMSCYSVGKSLLAHDSKVDLKTGTPLAIGASVGGVLGNQVFNMVKEASGNQKLVGAIQAGCLAGITLLTILYALFSKKIKLHQVKNAAACAIIGLLLGIISSFLGIGGGPINLMVLSFFFSMDTKVAAQNSLYIILFSQIASLITTLVTGSVPPFEWSALALMVVGGIGGGIVGRMLYKKMDLKAVNVLYICLMGIIVSISIYNCIKYLNL